MIGRQRNGVCPKQQAARIRLEEIGMPTKKFLWPHRFVCLLMVVSVMPRAASAMLPRDFQARIVAAHNRARAEVGVPPMRWDNRLANDAEQWARHLAQINRLVHWGSQ